MNDLKENKRRNNTLHRIYKIMSFKRPQSFIQKSNMIQEQFEEEHESTKSMENIFDSQARHNTLGRSSVRGFSSEKRMSDMYMRYSKSRVLADSCGRYQNPWSSWTPMTLFRGTRWLLSRNKTNLPKDKDDLDKFLPQIKPLFASDHKTHFVQQNLTKLEKVNLKTCCLRVTWLGHSSLLVEIDGLTILTDPVLSTSSSCLFRNCFMPRRIRAAPCSVNDLPENVNFVLISHNHYDHLDKQTVLDLNARFGVQLFWIVPKGLRTWFARRNIRVNVIETMWWEEYSLSLIKDNAKFNHEENILFCDDFPKLVCLPAQHWSGRYWFDNNRTLWASFAIIGHRHRFFFAGDTGYCDAFAQIGTLYGPFDLTALPIGAYGPERFARSQHMTPEDAVQAHVDLNSKHSVAIHWGTFALGKEYFYEPVVRLRAALENNRLNSLSFATMMHGETMDLTSKKQANSLLPVCEI